MARLPDSPGPGAQNNRRNDYKVTYHPSIDVAEVQCCTVYALNFTLILKRLTSLGKTDGC